MTSGVNAKLVLADIDDVRAYERVRSDFRRRIMQLKERRRVHVGTVISIVFENRDTVRFQVQEMARAEKLVTDEQIQTELDIYNPLIPERGTLRATLFIECTTEEQMRAWLPKLVGIERSLELVIGEPSDASAVRARCRPDAHHEAQLTRDDITAAVHYVGFDVGVSHADAIRIGPLALACVHPAYRETVLLGEATRRELASDVAG